MTAAQESARQVADTSGARGSVARERAALARLALRGELPTSRWRWAAAGLTAGLAAGVVIGVVAAATVSRRSHPVDPADPDAVERSNGSPSAVLDKARAAAAALGERAGTAVHTAAATARDAADKARKTVTREPTAELTPPTATPSRDAGREPSARRQVCRCLSATRQIR